MGIAEWVLLSLPIIAAIIIVADDSQNPKTKSN